ncbi:MAG: hypothetical protein H6523_10035 [Mycolicibacterium sp.]|jgi:hypothetical protein|nr:hypothetical protein [Mycolicibacterium sp.]
MANELLDFVMGLVRDPAAAANYHADPAKAIADAHLTGVTSADVNNLIPMVSDSVSMATPGFGPPGLDSVPVGGLNAVDSNVWSSGAAHAAFEAFDAHVPGVVADQLHTPVIQDPGAVSGVLAAPVSALHDGGVQLPSFDSFDQVGGIGTALPDPVDAHPADPVFEDWAHPAHDAGHVDPGHGGFDIFGHQ